MIPQAPRIWKSGDKLLARTGWISTIISAGLWIRRLSVDPKSKTILIRNRFLWFITWKRKIRFREVTAVTYKYEDFSPDRWISFSYMTHDLFTVGLRLISGDDVSLFSFYGGGSFVRESLVSDWLFWPDYSIELPFSQEQPSRLFVEVLSRLLDVEVIPGS